MGHQETGVNAFPASFLVPDDGDALNASTLNVPYEALADRTTWLKVRIDQLDEAADLTALGAIAAPTNGLTRIVKDFGFYRFDSASIMPVTSPMAIAAADLTPGKWLWSGINITGAANGIAFLTAGGQLSVSGSGYPTFQTTRTRTRQIGFSHYDTTFGPVTRERNAAFAPFGGSTAEGRVSSSYGVLKFEGVPQPTTNVGVQICLDNYVHDGARLASVVAQVKGAGGHGFGLPGTMPAIGVFRKQRAQGSTENLKVSGDFVLDTSASVAVYESAFHALTYACDRLNSIDKANYSYFAQLWNEGGSGAMTGLQVLNLELVHDTIADMRFP